MQKSTLFTQPACIYIGRFGISVSFLHVSGAACKPAVSLTRRIRFKKPETRDLNFSRYILTLTLEALKKGLNIFRLLIKVRRVGSFADIYRLGNTFFCFLSENRQNSAHGRITNILAHCNYNAGTDHCSVLIDAFEKNNPLCSAPCYIYSPEL